MASRPRRVSAIVRTLDDSLAEFARRRPAALSDPGCALREGARGRHRQLAGGDDCGGYWDGRRQILGVERANRESRSSWRTFLLGLRERGLSGVELVVADDHAGLRAAIREVLSEAAYQRRYVHFLRNALDHLPRKADDDCLQELRWLYDRRSVEEARRDLAAWIAKWEGRYPRLVAWAEETIEETLTFYRLPRQHHKHLKSTNMLEPLNEEIRRRSCVSTARARTSRQHEVDRIADFTVQDDLIYLDNRIFTKLGKLGSEASPAGLSAKFFMVGEKAKDRNYHVIHDRKNGLILYDADGSGTGHKAVEIATLSKNLKISASDFFVI